MRRFTGQGGLVSFKDLLIFQFLFEEYWGSCQRNLNDNKQKLNQIFILTIVLFLLPQAAVIQNDFFSFVEVTTVPES